MEMESCVRAKTRIFPFYLPLLMTARVATNHHLLCNVRHVADGSVARAHTTTTAKTVCK